MYCFAQAKAWHEQRVTQEVRVSTSPPVLPLPPPPASPFSTWYTSNLN